MFHLFLSIEEKMLGVAQPFGFATPTFIIEPIYSHCAVCWPTRNQKILRHMKYIDMTANGNMHYI